MFGGLTPSVSREKVTLADVKKELNDTGPFIDFLNRLDWSKTEIYLECCTTTSSSLRGYRVVHFAEKVEDKWNNTFLTWYGLGCMMA